MMKCGKCGNVTTDQAKFCNKCGSPLSASPPPPPSAASASAAPASAGAGGAAAALAVGAAPPGARPDPYTSRSSSATGGEAPPLFERLKNILLSPRSEWERIAPESSSIGSLYLRYAIPLLVAVAVLSFIHMSVIGTSTFFGGTMRLPMALGLTSAVTTVIAGIIGFAIVACIINMLAPTFGAQREMRQAFKVAIYAMTPGSVASVFTLIPGLGMLLGLIAVIYGIYVLYLGLVPVMQTPKERAVGYTATIIIVTIVLSILLGVLLGTMGHFGRLAGFGAMGSAAATRPDEPAAAAGNLIGSILGSDEKGKSDLGAAIANIERAGAQSNSAPATATPNSSASSSAAPAAPAESSSDQAQQAGAAVGGLLSALGGALNGGRRVDPVDYNTLKGMLPDSLPNMQRVSAEGSAKQGLGVQTTSSKAVYTGARGARVEIEIGDASAVAGLMNVADALPNTTSSSSDTGYEKDVMIGGYRAHEKYDSSAQHAELSFIVAKRFTVDFTGDHVDMATLESDAGRVDLGKLTSMKDAGAH